ncbi:MAG: phosphate acyltransferase PlsX [Puniceicoccales bacterium]|jgi:glycerol-3-phosphate acyltransferase PlsX|nr:phosphate acyltransferase PlsX [Puniceicoccales bacterium]
MSSDRLVVAVDVMGSDGGASLVVRGVEYAVNKFPGEIGELVLVGDSVEIGTQISRCGRAFRKKSVEICHASQSIDMAEKPMSALRNKKDSSMFTAIGLLKNGEVSGILSCGNTGCLVAGGTLKLRTMPGIARPALASVIPVPGNHFVLVDVGANPSTTTANFVHNAVMGALYHKAAINSKKEPRVGLLTIGTEEGKGSEAIREAHEMLKKIDGEINYCGLVEGFQMFSNSVDVVVCDGFVGNILLKTIEALAGTLKNYVRKEMGKNPLRILGGILARGVFMAMKRDLSADSYGGAPLLGLNGAVVKAHGSSSVEAVASALRLTFKLAKVDNKSSLTKAIERVNALILR